MKIKTKLNIVLCLATMAVAGILITEILLWDSPQKKTQIVAWLVLYGIIIGNIFWLQRHVVRPLSSLAQGAAEVTGGNKDFLFSPRNPKFADETDDVKNAFNSMLISLKKALGEIQAKNKELETLLYVISHDLKEPLRSIQFFSGSVRDRYAQSLEPQAQDYLTRCVQGSVRMAALLDDVLALARARKGTEPPTVIPAMSVVGKALERLENRIKETGATVEVKGNFTDLKADVIWAQEAVYNLMDNALKFVRPGEKPQVEIVPYLSEQNRGHKETGIVIQDRGPGVSPEMAERIFGLFQRGVGRDIEGTGAGLAIVRAIVERYNGRVWMEPREGGGSKFIITFQS